MRTLVLLCLVGVAAGTSYTYRRAQELRDELSLLDEGVAASTGPEQSPSEAILSDLKAAPLATGATAAAQGPKPSESMPAPSGTGPAARGSIVTGQVGVTGYSEKDFVAAAQLPFRRAVAAVLDIDEALVKVTGIDADVAAGVSLGKVTKGKDNVAVPEKVSFPDAPAAPEVPRPTVFLSLRGGDGACRVDFSAAVDAGKGSSAASKVNNAVASGSFLKKFQEFGAAKATAARMTEKAAFGAGPTDSDSSVAEKEKNAPSQKRWRTGAGHWEWVSKAHTNTA